MNDKLIIIGAGSLGVMTLDAALEMNKYNYIYFIDDGREKGEFIHNAEVLGGLSILHNLDESAYDFVIAIANNEVREKIAKENELNYVNIIHPTTAISRFASIIGVGNIILPNVSIDPETVIQNHVIINKNCSLGHNVTMKDYSQASPGSQLGGLIEKRVFIGLGATVLPNIKVDKDTIVGAGSVVNKDLPANVTAVGVPAKVIKER